MTYKLTPLSDESIVIDLGNEIDPEIQKQIQVIAVHLGTDPFPGMVEYIPAYTTLTILYDLAEVRSYRDQHEFHETTPYQLVVNWIDKRIDAVSESSDTSSRLIHIPVCYGSDHGPDLGVVAEHNGLSEEEVKTIHVDRDYLVYMIGFAPGFPYVGGMAEEIATPRRDSPRVTIPAGSVGIAGKQTGVYPIETPGGWQLIGQTPIELFRPDKTSPSFLKPGDTVRFYPISETEYQNWKEDNGDGNHDT